MIRYAKPEQIAPLSVFSALVLTRTHLNPCHFWDIAGEISKWKKVWDYHWNNLLKSIQLKYQGQWAYVYAHTLVGFLFVSCSPPPLPPPHWQCKELHRSFCSFENPPDNVGSWLLAWAGWILKKKKKGRKKLCLQWPVQHCTSYIVAQIFCNPSVKQLLFFGGALEVDGECLFQRVTLRRWKVQHR